MEFLTVHGAAILFYAFAAVAVVAACFVVTMRNPMYGAIALLVTFLSVAALFLLRHAEFLAFVQVFVYAGGIMVLFLFVIMLVNVSRLKDTRLFGQNAPMAAVVGLLLLGLFVVLFAGVAFAPTDAASTAFVDVDGTAVGNSEAVAWVLFREYLLPFEIVSLFLLVAMIGAVILGREQ